ncbi:MAG: ABC transporter substrate-binding protein [Lachnospiraceae bacterium]|nr:ABC transporter substrate-binding protein [Lachnospiraceae bacterium]
MRRFSALILTAALLFSVLLGSCTSPSGNTPAANGPSWSSLAAESETELRYATQFHITKYTGGYQLVEIETTGRFLLVPEGKSAPKGLPEDITLLYQPLDRIYLTATSAMDFFCALQSIESIRLSGTNAEGWYIQEAKEALENGSILFAGKYSAPDYELIYAEKCDLAVESTMIYHSPEIKEQLEKLGVPVVVERSSYEEHPLGRMEWIKFYGALLGKEAEAEKLFNAEAESVEALEGQPETGKTVAFFYINAAGTANVRKSTDYVPRMIRMAGGEYVFTDLDSGSALSTVNMTMEAFYDGAKNADLLIYNSTIDGELQSIGELLQKSSLLADFKAVQSGDVWCTGKNLFQEPMGLGRLIGDIHRVLTGDVPEDGQLTYLHKLTK